MASHFIVKATALKVRSKGFVPVFLNPNCIRNTQPPPPQSVVWVGSPASKVILMCSQEKERLQDMDSAPSPISSAPQSFAPATLALLVFLKPAKQPPPQGFCTNYSFPSDLSSIFRSLLWVFAQMLPSQ